MMLTATKDTALPYGRTSPSLEGSLCLQGCLTFGRTLMDCKSHDVIHAIALLHLLYIVSHAAAEVTVNLHWAV